MNNKFNSIPIEPDTKVLFHKESKLHQYDVRYEIWNWDGIEAESIIFSNDDIGDLTDQEIKKLVWSLPIKKEESAMTLNRSETGYIFCNFNFE